MSRLSRMCSRRNPFLFSSLLFFVSALFYSTYAEPVDLSAAEVKYDVFDGLSSGSDVPAANTVFSFNYENDLVGKRFMRVYQGDAKYTVTDGNDQAVAVQAVEAIALENSGTIKVNVGATPGPFGVQVSQSSPLFIYTRFVSDTELKVTIAVNGLEPTVPKTLVPIDREGYKELPISSYAYQVDADGNKFEPDGPEGPSEPGDPADPSSLAEDDTPTEPAAMHFRVIGDTLEFRSSKNCKLMLGRVIKEFFPTISATTDMPSSATIYNPTDSSADLKNLNKRWDTLMSLVAIIGTKDIRLEAPDTRSLLDIALDFYHEKPMIVYGAAGGLVLIIGIVIYCCCCAKETIVVPGPMAAAPMGPPMGMGMAPPSFGPPGYSMGGGYSMRPPSMAPQGGFGGW